LSASNLSSLSFETRENNLNNCALNYVNTIKFVNILESQIPSFATM
jgi:hypothetical protein